MQNVTFSVPSKKKCIPILILIFLLAGVYAVQKATQPSNPWGTDV